MQLTKSQATILVISATIATVCLLYVTFANEVAYQKILYIKPFVMGAILAQLIVYFQIAFDFIEQNGAKTFLMGDIEQE